MYALAMLAKTTGRDSRRSTRVSLAVDLAIQDGASKSTCEAQTVVVNAHGARLSTAQGLKVGMKVLIHVYISDKRAAARVVYVDPENALLCGVELDHPQNIWGVPMPPADWDESDFTR